MPLVIYTQTELNNEEILKNLRELRTHALVDSSHFAVAAIIQIKLPNGQFAYVSGVNVEHADHNRLGMHAEQNAIVAAKNLFGEHMTFLKAWVMGAPDTIERGSEHILADNFVQPCGHCRQILLSFSEADTEIYSVTVNGAFGVAKKLSDLLPDAFSERDLVMASPATSDVIPLPIEPAVEPLHYTSELIELNDEHIRARLAAIRPHVLNSMYQTSSISACVLKVMRGTVPQYFTGALVQDIAFLTTDAIYSAVGQAITSLGWHDLVFQEIHLYGATLDPLQLTGCERSHLARFSTMDTCVKFHTSDASSQALSFVEGTRDYAHQLVSKMQPTLPAQEKASSLDKKIRIISVAGASGSGKTTIAKKLYDYYGEEQCVIISSDNYYKDLGHMSAEEWSFTNFDHPDSIDFRLLAHHLFLLKQGQTVDIPTYDFATHSRTEKVITVNPKPIIIVEGILTQHASYLMSLYDMSVFVDTELDICLARRVVRDTAERGRTASQVIFQYKQHVKPMYVQFVAPCKDSANLVILNSADHCLTSVDVDFDIMPVIQYVNQAAQCRGLVLDLGLFSRAHGKSSVAICKGESHGNKAEVAEERAVEYACSMEISD